MSQPKSLDLTEKVVTTSTILAGVVLLPLLLGKCQLNSTTPIKQDFDTALIAEQSVPALTVTANKETLQSVALPVNTVEASAPTNTFAPKDLANSKKRLKDAKQTIDSLKVDLAAKDLKLQEALSHTLAKDATLDNLQAQKTLVAAEVAKHSELSKTLETELAKTKTELDKIQTELESTKQELTKAQDALNQNEAESQSSQATSQKTQEELAKAQEEAKKAQEELAKIQEEAKKNQEELAKTEEEAKKNQEELTKIQAEFTKIKDELASLKESQATESLAASNTPTKAEQELEELKRKIMGLNTEKDALRKSAAETEQALQQKITELSNSIKSGESTDVLKDEIKKVEDEWAKKLDAQRVKSEMEKAKYTNALKTELNELRISLRKEKTKKVFADSSEDLAPSAQNLIKKLSNYEGSSEEELKALYEKIETKLQGEPRLIVNFSTGSSVVSAKHKTEIKELLASAKPNSYFIAVGYADHTGTAYKNKALSSKRATKVVEVIKPNLNNTQFAQAFYLGQTKRFGSAENNRVVEIWEIHD